MDIQKYISWNSYGWWFNCNLGVLVAHKKNMGKRMKRLIKKNRRRPFPSIHLFPLIFVRRKKSFIISKWVKFTGSCMYHFDDEDQYDANKLFGFSVGYHHNNSFRFGWRPNADCTKMEIVGYEYHDGVRIPTIPICEVELNRWYKYDMIYFSITREVKYCVYDEDHNTICAEEISPIKLKHRCNLGYYLYLYFGGNKKAPHDMMFFIERG